MRKLYRLVHGVSFFLFFTLLWWAFTDGSSYQIWMGGLFISLASIVALRSTNSSRLLSLTRGGALIRFVFYFIYESIRGGILVSKLAIMPQDSVRSEYINFKTQIPSENQIARFWFASTICVFPGTLSCGYTGDTLVIHALNVGIFDEKSIRKLERIAGAVFGV